MLIRGGVRCSGEPFLSDRWIDTLMSPDQLSRPAPFAVEWPRETGAHTDFPYLRRKIDRGAPLDTSQNRDVWRANEACLDALAPLLTGDGQVWLPGVEAGEARRLLGRAMAEQRMVATTTPADLDRYASAMTVEQVDAALTDAGVSSMVRALTPVEREALEAKAAEHEARWRAVTLADLRNEDQAEIGEVLHDLGFDRPLDGLSNDELSLVLSMLAPDSY